MDTTPITVSAQHVPIHLPLPTAPQASPTSPQGKHPPTSVWPPTLAPTGEVSRAAPRVRSWQIQQNLAPAKRLGQGVSGTVYWGEGKSGRGFGPRRRPRPHLPKPCGFT